MHRCADFCVEPSESSSSAFRALSGSRGVEPVGGTFRVNPESVPANEMAPFRSGAVILPGLQNEYRVTPDGVNVAVGRFNMYVDENGNGVFDRVQDKWYIGVPRLEDPLGFFTLLYVDKAAYGNYS